MNQMIGLVFCPIALVRASLTVFWPAGSQIGVYEVVFYDRALDAQFACCIGDVF